MLQLEQIKEHTSSWVSRFSVFTSTAQSWTRFFHPKLPQSIRRLQLFWLSCGGIIIVAFTYGMMTFLFEKTPLHKQEEVKPISTSIETATKKVNIEEVFRNSIEDKLKALSDKITAVETLFQEGVKREGFSSQNLNTEGENQDPSLNSSFPKSSLIQDLETKILQLEHQLDMQKNNSLPSQALPPQFFPYQAGQEEEKNLIQKVSLGLTENLKLKLPKTVDTTIPAGAFAKTVLLSGLDASSAMTASSRADHRYGTSSARLKLANEFLQTHSLSDLLPYRSFDPETQLFLNRSSIGFVLETLPLVGCGEAVPRQLTGIFQHALPLGSNLQCLLIASPHIDSWLKTWEAARHDLSSTPERADVLRELAKERCFAFRNRPAIRTFRLFISYSESHTIFKSFEEILALREQLVTTLKGWGLPVKVWQAEDLLLGLDELLNPTERLLGNHQSLWNPYESLSPQLMNPATRVMVEPPQLIFGEGERVLRLYTTRLLPLLWHLSAMGHLIGDPFEEFLRLQGGFFLSYSVHICNEKTLKTKMLAKCGNVEKQAASPIAKYVPSLKKEAEEWTYVREKFEEGQRLVRTRFQVGFLNSPDQIAREEQTLFNLYRSQRWELVLDKYLQLPAFLSCLPMTWGEGAVEDSKTFQKTKTTLSHEPSNLIPLQGEWQGTKSPGMMLAGRRGQIFYWSPFDNNEGNYNTCVVGRSGSGKSVFMQELLTSILGMGGRVFVLDVGRSFEKTVKLLKGTFVEFSTHSPICINPFSSLPSHDAEAASDGLAMLKPILSLMAAPKEGTTDLEDTYLEQALQEAWDKNQNKATITDVADVLLKLPDRIAVTLGKRLRPYTEKGSYGRFFTGEANIDLSDNLVVVEMEELKERKDLQSVIVQMVILQITNSIYMGDRKTPSCLILDEAWDMLRGAQSDVFIETAARRLRKYFGGLVVGTQSVNDFYATPGAQAAFDNSDWMCLLSQKDESIELLKNSKRLSMDPAMERTLRSLHTEQGKYAEIMIKGPKGFAVGRLFLDEFSKVLYSTKAEEFTVVQNLVSQGFSLKEAIQMMVKVPL